MKVEEKYEERREEEGKEETILTLRCFEARRCSAEIKKAIRTDGRTDSGAYSGASSNLKILFHLYANQSKKNDGTSFLSQKIFIAIFPTKFGRVLPFWSSILSLTKMKF